MTATSKKISFVPKFVVAILLMISGSNYAMAGQTSMHNEVCTRDSVVIKRMSGGRHHNTRLYHDMAHERLVFKASGRHGKSFQLFLFNMSGELIKQSTIQAMETAVLSDIQKGNYLFEVFNNDLRIENGSIAIK